MILILPGDIKLNPGPVTRHQIKKENFEFFNNKGLHLMHLNINSDLNEIDELHYIANSSTLREKCPYAELFWSVFSRIRTEYGPE